MGRHGKRRGGGGGGGSWDGGGRGGSNADGGGKKPRLDGPAKDNYYVVETEKENLDFEAYYKDQSVVPEGEWDAFMACLRTPLPVTFRINGCGSFADHLRDKLQEDFFSKLGDQLIMIDGEPMDPPRPLPWYPNNYAWHMSFSRGQLRKLPPLEALHEYLKKANDVGSISRQEAVSMVPPMFLDVRPHHKVFDMCAAPGSKTFQLLEALHSDKPLLGGSNDPTAPQPTAGSVAPQGYVVANDSDFKRCSLLTHQIKRVNSPCLLVTNHNAQHFPMLKSLDGTPLRFDRILCDVPCSGDGTMRKAPDIWRRWSVANGNGLHMLQLHIALHGARMLEVGGRMVYSTCTFNPIENEAVVAAVLQQCGSAVQLCDVSDWIPKLKRLPGKHTWKVRDNTRWYDSWEEAQEVGHNIEPSMFSGEHTKALPLERCMRFLPHHQDTGGFFVAVLQKVGELPRDFRPPNTFKPTGRAQKRRNATTAIADPLATACQAATDALEAAKAAVAGLAAGDAAAVNQAALKAGVAAAMANRAAEAVKSGAQAGQDAGSDGYQLGVDAAAEGQEEPGQQPQDAAAVLPEAVVAVEDTGAAAATVGEVETAAKAETAAQVETAAKVETDVAVSDGAAAVAGPTAAAGEVAARGAPRAYTGPSWVRGSGGRGRSDGKHSHIDPVVPVEDPYVLQPVTDYFGVQPSFPMGTQLVTRSMEVTRPKRVYLVSKEVVDLMVSDRGEQLKIIAVGLKLFDRQEAKDYDAEGNLVTLPVGAAPQCAYRIAQEGLPFLLPHVTRQLITLSTADFLALLRDRHLNLPSASAEARQQAAAEAAAQGTQAAATLGPRKIGLSDPEVLATAAAARFGCVICQLKESDAVALGLTTGAVDDTSKALSANAPMALTAWKGRASLAIMVDRSETMQMIDKIEAAQKRMQA